MPCQIKETQAAASHKAEYNSSAEQREGSFCCSWHAGTIEEEEEGKQIPAPHGNQAKLLTLKGDSALRSDGPNNTSVTTSPDTPLALIPGRGGVESKYPGAREGKLSSYSVTLIRSFIGVRCMTNRLGETKERRRD